MCEIMIYYKKHSAEFKIGIILYVFEHNLGYRISS